MFGLVTKRELVRAHERERLAWERERTQLLDRIMLLADKPWLLPPRPVEPEPELDDRIHYEPV